MPAIDLGAADIDGFSHGLDGVDEGKAIVMRLHNNHHAAMGSAPISIWRFDHDDGFTQFVTVEVEADEIIGG